MRIKSPKLPLSPAERQGLRRSGLRLADIAGCPAADLGHRTGWAPERVTLLQSLAQFQQLPHVGPASAGDFVLLGFTTPSELIGADAMALYHRLQDLTGSKQDPCVIDVFDCAIYHVTHPGEEDTKPWWDWSAKRLAKGQ